MVCRPKDVLLKGKIPDWYRCFKKISQVVEFFFVICKCLLKRAQMSPFVRNGGMEPSDGERGGRVEFGSWAALNARFDKILL